MSEITACTMDCPDACSLTVSADDGSSVVLRGNPEHPFTAGFTCAKIRGHIRRLQSAERIVQPMQRTADGWQVIAWDEALNLCARKIQKLRAEPKAILHIHGSGAKGVLKEAGALLFNRLGTSRTWGSLCDAAGYMAYIRDFGSRKNHHLPDLLNAAAIVNWGKDLARSSVHSAAIVRAARRNGTRVLTVSPGGDDSGEFSDGHLRIRPGTDRFLAAAVIRQLVERDHISNDILGQTRNPQKFLSLISTHGPGPLLDACDVSPGDLERLFQVYAAAGPVATLVGTGLQRYVYGGENVRFINALALLSGHIGVPGGGSYFQQHAYRNLELGWIENDHPMPRRSFPLPAVAKEILAARNPPVKMIWVNGINVVNQAPDSREIVKAFEQVGFKVVVDAFFNDTARCADLVLPARLMLEQEDVVGSFLHEYVQYVPAVMEAPGEARDDYWILSEIAKRLTPRIRLPDKETCLRSAVDSSFLNTTLELIRDQKSVRSNRPEIVYADLKFDHRDGKYRFPSALHPETPAPAGYPLHLLSLVRRKAQHSQMLPGQQKIPPQVWIAPDSPALRDLDPAKAVCLVSPLGRLKVSLKTKPGLHPEAVIYRRGDWMCLGGGVNQLIEAKLTDIGSGAAFYSQYVRLENV
jgi:anaerobic selenocysteine-containing dehydrogenase